MTQNFSWWQTGTIYQIYPRSFKDTTGNGIGDLQGIIDKLDYLQDGTPNALGIDAIWISPFYPSPMADAGYDIANYTDVEPIFGDLATFDRLIEEAHRRGIKVIVDYVPNHTSDEHPWFVESRSSRDNPKRDWYIWRDGKPDGGLPNNWGSMFGGPAWRYDETTGQYYFHQFHYKQPDLNWRNPEVRQAMLDVLRFWLERGVDGFRMDVVYLIWKHPDMPDQPFTSAAAEASARADGNIFGRQEHPYDMDYDGIHDIMREMRQLLDEYGDTVGIGEMWLPLEQRARYYGNGDELHLPFNFDLITEKQWAADRFRSAISAYMDSLPEHGWPNFVLGNHDVHRLATRFGADAARTAAMLLLTLRGTPTLYMGDELGLPNGNIPHDQMQDPQVAILGPESSRDVARTPMQWDDSTHAGFSATRPWLPVTPDYTTRNVKSQSSDPTSMLSLYRRLIALRKATPALNQGDFAFLDDLPSGVLGYSRTTDDDTFLILLNFTGDAKSVTISQSARLILSTTLDRDDFIYAGQSITLNAHEGVIIVVD